MILKCKNCGGDIQLSENDKTIGVCDSCGSTMTFPKISDEQRTSAFNRGNHFRRIGEFDKALSIYEHIVEEDNSDAEAHWCCALCRFGIEYVKDPATSEWLPTCHRASYDNFTDDVDYLAALEYSDGVTRDQYKKDAAQIAEVQKKILAVSRQEEPYDVFICYKETDDQGKRTIDSTLAQDIYYQLSDKGYRVFFARISLEDKVGKEYEPLIFAALNSAKVMLVIGTKNEYFNAVWVKNEWSRFLAIVKKDRSKMILPCYRDMDAYDLPDELSILQSYDMAKIGFIQDLIRGIQKIIPIEEMDNKGYGHETRDDAVDSHAPVNVESLIERAYMALEDEKWDEADGFFERALDIDSKCARAYAGKFLLEKRCADFEEYVYSQLNYLEQLYADIKRTKQSVHVMEQDRVRQQIEQNNVPGYLDKHTIEEEYEKFNDCYISATSGLEELYDVYLQNIRENRNYVRAVEFASGSYKDEIVSAVDKIECWFKEKIEQSEQKDKDEETQIFEKFDEYFEKVSAKINKLYEQAKKDSEEDIKKQQMAYDNCVSRAKQISDTTELSEFMSLIDELNAMGVYEDSRDLAQKVREAMYDNLISKISGFNRNSERKDYEIVIEGLRFLGTYKHSDELIYKVDEELSKFEKREIVNKGIKLIKKCAICVAAIAMIIVIIKFISAMAVFFAPREKKALMAYYNYLSERGELSENSLMGLIDINNDGVHELVESYQYGKERRIQVLAYKADNAFKKDASKADNVDNVRGDFGHLCVDNKLVVIGSGRENYFKYFYYSVDKSGLKKEHVLEHRDRYYFCDGKKLDSYNEFVQTKKELEGEYNDDYNKDYNGSNDLCWCKIYPIEWTRQEEGNLKNGHDKEGINPKKWTVKSRYFSVDVI